MFRQPLLFLLQRKIQTTDMNLLLITAAIADLLAAILHIACIIFGSSLYQFVGAGTNMVNRVRSGQLFPHLITLTIALILLLWATYALAGAGLPITLPYIKWVLLVISIIYLVRGSVGFFIPPSIDRSQIFWWWSSSICLVIGMIHAMGLWQVWHHLQAFQTLLNQSCYLVSFVFNNKRLPERFQAVFNSLNLITILSQCFHTNNEYCHQ